MSFNLRQAGIKARENLDKFVAEKHRVPVMELTAVNEGKVTIKEMIGTDDGAAEFVEKITYDLAQGQSSVPLLYEDFYSTQTDPNFPKTLLLEEFGNIQVVFLEKFEGGEVKFGAMGPGEEKSVSFHTYAAGVEYDEDIVEYNQTWQVSNIGVAFGVAYTRLLNHLHLYPLMSASYDASSQAAGLPAQKIAQEGDLTADGSGAVAQDIKFDTNLATTLQDAAIVLPAGTKLLINSIDQLPIETALAGAIYADYSPMPIKQKFDSSSFIVYDGSTVKVGSKVYTYPGVTPGLAYLITPNSPLNFQELIKHDLRVDSNDGDLSRLILAQVVGRARRAVVCAPAGQFGAVQLHLYASDSVEQAQRTLAPKKKR
jgi:hypothetical protein